MDQRITRRGALTTGTLSAIGIGLMAAAGGGPEPVAAEPAPELFATISLAGPVAPVMDAAWLADWRAELEELYEEEAAAWAAIKAYLPGDGFALRNRLDVALGVIRDHDQELLVERLASHLPGLAPAIRAVYAHVLEWGSYSSMPGCCATIPEEDD